MTKAQYLGRTTHLLTGFLLILATVHCGSNSTVGKSVVVTITSPTSAQTVPVNGTLAISATITGTSNHAVAWSVNGVSGGNATVGTISGSGLTVVYNAPASIPSPATFNITVTSSADPSKSASLAVTISAGVVISISSPVSPQSLSVSSTLAFTASIAGTTNTNITWTVNGITNGNSTFGTISGTGLNVSYTAPATVPTPAAFNVTATSVADSTQSASVSVTITAGVGISITIPSSASASVPAQQGLGLTAAVFGTPNVGVTWTVNGITGGNSTYGTIDGSGLAVTFNAPQSIPAPASYSITVTSQADPSKSASISATITAPVPLACGSGNESILSGQYAFLLKGFNHNGFTGVVGALNVDGKGHITAGELDLNSTGGAGAAHTTVSASPASFYSVGSDDRGCATIVTASGITLKTRFDLGVISDNIATQGELMEYDAANSSALVATGGIFLQNTANLLVLQGGAYVNLLTGWDSTAGGRIACGGIHTNSDGNVSGSEETCNDAGTFTTTGPTVGSSGNYSSIDTSGRFTEVVASRNFVTYFVTEFARPGIPSEVTLETDANPVMAGTTIFQMTNTYSKSSFVGDYAVFASGINSASSGKIFIAFATSDGSSGLTLNSYNEDDAGTWHSPLVPPVDTYNVDFLGGVSLTQSGPVATGEIYLTGTPFNVYIGADAGGFAGYAVTQTGSGTLANSTLDGNFFGGSAEIVNQSAPAELDVESLDGKGDVSITTDNTSTSNQAAGQTLTQAISITPNGTISITDNPSQAVGIAISPNFYVTAGSDSTAYPSILFFTLNAPPT